MSAPLTLVALHGLGGDHTQPLAYIDEAVRSKCRIVAPDLRAHGSCTLDESPSLLTFQQLAADVDAAIGPSHGPLVLVGISMGAGVALELVARGTPGISALVLVRPAWLWEPNPANLVAFPRIASLLREHGAQVGKARFVQDPDYASVAAISSAAADALAAQFDEPRAIARGARLEALPASVPRHVSRLDVPTVVLACDRDPVHPVQLAERLTTDLGARLVVVPPRYDLADAHAREVAREIRRVVEKADQHRAR
jgi:pimeloyl-ACP methyl ester carboxylesterase